jgi:mono/diheme cytochrome c family protein
MNANFTCPPLKSWGAWLALLWGGSVAACTSPYSRTLSPEVAGIDTTGFVETGEYLVRSVAVCGQCHAEDIRDPDGPLLGGFEFKSWRFGTYRAANLTPDSATGLGRWTVGEIVRALRTGVDDQGKVLLPVMPYEWLRQLSDRDALAIALYLKSAEPVRQETEDDPNLIISLVGELFIRPAPPVEGSVQAPPLEPSVEYGRYLAVTVGLCANCHTPRGGLQQGFDRDRMFAGDPDPPGDFPVPPANLTPDSATGIGRWSEEDFIRTIRQGVNPDGDSLNSFMSWKQYGRMTDMDLRAIYRYLRTLPPIRNEIPDSLEG